MRVQVVNRRGTFSGGLLIYRVPKVTDSTVFLYIGTNFSLKIFSKRFFSSGEGGGVCPKGFENEGAIKL
jgi:hypothetical protein